MNGEWKPQVPTLDEVARLVAAVQNKVPPVWPLQDYVAVNPFLGFSGSTVLHTAFELGMKAGIRLTMPREFYQRAHEAGVIQQTDLAAAADWWRKVDGFECDASQLEQAMRAGGEAPVRRLPTVAGDVAGLPVDSEWVVDHITAWAGSYFDRSLATWSSPWSHLRPWEAFQSEVRLDTSLSATGVEVLSELVDAAPADSLEVIAEGLRELGIPTNGQADYLHCLSLSIAGWAGLARQRDWGAASEAQRIQTFCDLLAIRLVWDWALLKRAPESARDAWWLLVRRFYAGNWQQELEQESSAIGTDVALHWAYENARQRQLVELFNAPKPAPPPRRTVQVQAVFCIDVRSEPYRRALERVAPQVETFGFAGFFGFPISVTCALGTFAQCPVLLSPGMDVSQSAGRPKGFFGEMGSGVRQVCGEMKGAAVASFTFVEAWGGSYVANLFARVTRASASRSGTQQTLEMGSLAGAGGPMDLDDERVVTAAHNAVKGMGLRQMAGLVVLVGHEAACENNPHAAGLNCGACGGHSGAPNALFAANVLNDARVRARLAERGCPIPDTTWFVAAVHRTTTDEVVILNSAECPASRAGELQELTSAFLRAGEVARREREFVRSGQTDGSIWFERSRDWSEPRPELGLAGCHAFIVAPRALSRDLDFGGRAFLHTYDWSHDPGFGILEAIMTAPMVVTNWINLQYFASTVDPEHYGCGNKVLHNVVANIGVLEGRGGDLRTGLSLQSIYEGSRLFHDPLKLNVFIAAPTEAIDSVLSKHAEIRSLADQGWLHLWTLDDNGRVVARYSGGLQWVYVPVSRRARTAA